MPYRLSLRLSILLLILCPGRAILALEESPDSRPRTALVLGGGGARGAAHIGVLEILQRERIPFDCVAGTSMGALVAGAYAAGLSPAQMREKLKKADWTNMFLDSADYSQMNYRTKRVTEGLLPGAEIGLSDEGLQITSGLVSGEKIKLFFNQLVGDDVGGRMIEELRLPLAIIATDIGSGEKIVLKNGSLTHAMRASMSVPGFMAPVEYEGAKLVDGGLVDNVPIQVGRELCNAERVIAVDVGTPLKPADKVTSLLSVTVQMIGILTRQNVAYSVASLGEHDIYITPELGDITATEFARYKEAADLGYAAADARTADLQQFAVTPDAYARWRAELHDERELISTIDTITIAPMTRVNPIFVRQLIRQQEGEPLDREQLEVDLIRIYGMGGFDNVDYQVQQIDGKNNLTILARENKASSDYLTFGFSINEERREGSSINLRTAFRNVWLNRYGGEFFAVMDLGSNSSFEVDFYQPLNQHQSWFIEPSYVTQRDEISIYLDNEKIAEYDLRTDYAQILAGRNIGIWGQARIGWRQYHTRGRSQIGVVELPNIDERYDGWVAETIFDSRNRLYFPSKGWSGGISYFESAEQDYRKAKAELSGTYLVGDYVWGMRTSYVTAIDDELPLFDAELLGGFLNLSGYATDQIWTNGAFYSHIRAEKIIGHMPLGLSGDVRMGIAVEGAKLEEPINLGEEDEWLDSAIVYFGGETPLGPVYLGYGFTFSGDFNIYFQLGAF